jgi:hypothetical protein
VNRTVIVGIIAGILFLATAATAGTLNLAIVSALEPAPQCSKTPCDGWGDSTSDAATNDGRAVGEHTKNADDKPGPGRDGLGNFAEEKTGHKNPSDLGDSVGGNLPP